MTLTRIACVLLNFAKQLSIRCPLAKTNVLIKITNSALLKHLKRKFLTVFCCWCLCRCRYFFGQIWFSLRRSCNLCFTDVFCDFNPVRIEWDGVFRQAKCVDFLPSAPSLWTVLPTFWVKYQLLTSHLNTVLFLYILHCVYVYIYIYIYIYI